MHNTSDRWSATLRIADELGVKATRVWIEPEYKHPGPGRYCLYFNPASGPCLLRSVILPLHVNANDLDDAIREAMMGILQENPELIARDL